MENQVEGELQSLWELKDGDEGRIERIEDQDLQFAMLSFGVSKGDIVELTNRAPLGEPLAIRIGNTKISLRKQDALQIWVRRQG